MPNPIMLALEADDVSAMLNARYVAITTSFADYPDDTHCLCILPATFLGKLRHAPLEEQVWFEEETGDLLLVVPDSSPFSRLRQSRMIR